MPTNSSTPVINTVFNAAIELATLNGKNGFTINGIALTGQSGCSVASAGDINGDGVADLVIGAIWASPGGRSSAGQSYIVFGRTTWTSPMELSSLNGANGFMINGIVANDKSGYSVASAGDINGDGVADLIIGPYYASPSGRTNAGQSYVVFGKRTPWASSLELSSLNGANGVIINGIAADDYSGRSVASAGDINGDGVADLAIGAPYADPSGRTVAGQSYVVFGKRTPWTSPLELSSLNGANGFMINGFAASDDSGISVAPAGDINGDGVADLVIGAYTASPGGRTYAGQSYVVFGKRTAWTSPLELSSLNGANGVILNGIEAGDKSGYPVASAGDINGDGVADLAIGAPYADPSGRNSAGQSYVVFGKRTAWTSPLELSSLNGANGVIINGIAAYDSSGNSVASAGDVNGDGVADLVIGADAASPNGRSAAGQSYVVFGKRTPWASPLELSSLNGANGVILNGIAAYDHSGYSVASAGDVNEDGVVDLVIGAYRATPISGRAQAGQSYIMLGDISIPLINNQLIISAGQSVTLNSNTLFAFTGNYTGEVYFSVSNVQNGYFQSLNNPGVSIAQFTQTQLNNDLVQFVSTSSTAPSYSVSTSTGIGNAIPLSPQSAQIYFGAPTTTTSTATYTNASTLVPTTVQVTTTATPMPTTTTVVTTPQGSITITNTIQSTTVTSSSSSVVFTTSSSSVSMPITTQPIISSTATQSTSTLIPTSSGMITITATASGQVTVTLPSTLIITSTRAATSMPNIITTNSVTANVLGSSPTPSASTTSMILSNLDNVTLALNASLTPTVAVTTTQQPALVNATERQHNTGSDISLIPGIAGAAAGVAIAGAAFFLYRRKKQNQNKIQLASSIKQENQENTEIFNIANPIHPTFKIEENENALLAESSADGWSAHYHTQGAAAWGDQYYTHHSVGTNKGQAVHDLASNQYIVPRASDSTYDLVDTQPNQDGWPAQYYTQDSAAWGAGYYTHQSIDLNKHPAVYDLASNPCAVSGASNSTYDLADNLYDASTLSSNQNSNVHSQSLTAFFESANKPVPWDRTAYTIGDGAWSKIQYEI